MKRLFLEIDEIDNGHLETLASLGSHMCGYEDTQKPFFHTTIGEAAFHVKETWQAVKDHSHIFVSTSLIPRYGYGSSFGSGMLMNNLMYKAIEEGVEGKSLYFFNEYDNIRWDELEKDLVDKCFRKNFLYVRDENFEKWEQVDIDKLIKEKL
jgi:hypothetical protein